ncbi:MAG: Xanthine dehydrogenase [Verrucomicrobia bacterium]|nr:Xanthine dehydrogenase [Verrucomicrobiota bacterium]
MKELLELAAARRRVEKETVAIATVLRVDGSSYRRVGARMLVGASGRMAGSVSGGCLEAGVEIEAQAAIRDGRDRLLVFDTTVPGDVIFGSGLGCQGKIWIGIEVLPAGKAWPLAKVVERVRRTRVPVAWVTRVVEGERGIRFDAIGTEQDGEDDNLIFLPASWRAAITEVFATARSQFVDHDGCEPVLVEWLGPPLALLAFGGGPDLPPLVNLAAQLGHEVTVIDRRPEVAKPENFSAAHRVLAAAPSRVRSLVRADELTVAVIMNHHYETDREVLAALLPLGLPYIALLGPQRRTARILDELRERGIETPATLLDALHGPAGLDIGAEDPTQIALSILAEIQATLANRPGGKLKFRSAPIHADAVKPECVPCALPA